MKKQVVFSGIQPSGNLHIGNYLGAIKQFVELQEENEAIFCVVDMHAITVPQDPEKLHKKTLEIAMLYLACGIDPKKAIIFIQSHVPAHAELGWILNTLTPLGELMRMTQFKEKEQIQFEFEDLKKLKTGLEKIGKNIEYMHIAGVQSTLHAISSEIEPIVDLSEKRRETLAGLLNYPTLMAADILLYQTDIVPVGEDQKQHMEFTRMIAEKFNNRLGTVFKIPKELINKDSARIMGLDDPSKKMSKSAENHNNYITILEEPNEIRRKIKEAVTDSGSEIIFDPKNKPAISNLLAIYSGFSGENIEVLEKKYNGKKYAEFKNDLSETVIAGLTPIQKKFKELENNKDEALKILKIGAEKANPLAKATLDVVKQKLGFVSLK